ncbi:MAG: hypothetical protein ACKVS8_13580 [Phycisphaerales bacterium]
MHPATPPPLGTPPAPLTWFRTTPWTLIDQLAGDKAQRDGALDSLLRIYWGAVYSYLRRQGHGPDDAAELAEGFFVHVVVSRELFDRADRAKGRLRSLMLTALRNYLADVRRHEAPHTRRRALGVDLHAEERLVAEAGSTDPADAFDRRWALAALEEAARRCEEHFLATDKAGHWAVFQARVMGPAVRAATAPPLGPLCEAHGFASAAHGAAAVQTVKKRFEAILQEVVAQTVRDEREAAAEFDDLLRVLG